MTYQEFCGSGNLECFPPVSLHPTSPLLYCGKAVRKSCSERCAGDLCKAVLVGPNSQCLLHNDTGAPGERVHRQVNLSHLSASVSTETSVLGAQSEVLEKKGT